MVPLTTIDSVKAHIGIRAELTEFDARLRDLVNIATAQIEAVTRRDFSAEYPTVGTAPDQHLDAPVGLKMAATIQAVLLWKKLDPTNIGVVADRADGSTGGTANRFAAQGLAPEALMLVMPYRRMLLGARP